MTTTEQQPPAHEIADILHDVAKKIIYIADDISPTKHVKDEFLSIAKDISQISSILKEDV